MDQVKLKLRNKDADADVLAALKIANNPNSNLPSRMVLYKKQDTDAKVGMFLISIVSLLMLP